MSELRQRATAQSTASNKHASSQLSPEEQEAALKLEALQKRFREDQAWIVKLFSYVCVVMSVGGILFVVVLLDQVLLYKYYYFMGEHMTAARALLLAHALLGSPLWHREALCWATRTDAEDDAPKFRMMAVALLNVTATVLGCLVLEFFILPPSTTRKSALLMTKVAHVVLLLINCCTVFFAHLLFLDWQNTQSLMDQAQKQSRMLKAKQEAAQAAAQADDLSDDDDDEDDKKDL